MESVEDQYVVYSAEEGALQLRVVPSCSHTLRGIVNEVHVLFQIKTGEVPEEESVKRSPIDLAIVLDRSGSMSGEKLNFSKEAIKKVIENLSSTDKIHFVMYDTKADVIFEDGDLSNKDLLIQKVDAVKTGGATSISDGLEKGRDLLVKHRDPNANRTQRIYLFSDGLANSGLQTHGELFDLTRKIHDEKISTCAFGIGDDFDEDLMKGIAEYGHSYYFYIANSDEIETKVSNALGALLKNLGTDAVLKVRGKNGGIVRKVFGCDNLVKGVEIGDIKQNNLKNIIAELEVTPSASKDEEEVLTYDLTFTPRNAKEKTSVTGSLVISATDDESKLSKKNAEVNTTLIIQRSADIDSEIVKMIEARNIKGAVSLKEKDIAMLEAELQNDPTGRIESTLVKARQFMEDIKSKKSQKHMLKTAKYHGELKRRDSADWLQMM